MTTFSIAMATHNGERFLADQLMSLRIQMEMPHELVVSDDASSDRTVEIVQTFADRAKFPVRIIRNERPLGYGENFMQAARACTGEWVAFCDQDDLWSPGKLSAVQRHIAPHVNLIVHNVSLVDEKLRDIGGLLYDYPERKITGPMGLPPEWHCIGMTQTFRRCLLDIEPAYRPSFPWHAHRGAHDVWISLLANAVGGVLRMNTPLVLYRRHGTTVTSNVKVTNRLMNNGQEYALRAAYMGEIADLLQPLAPASADKIRQSAKQMRMRADIYEGPRMNRLRSFAALAAKGGYTAANFGVGRALKDAAFGIFAN